MPKTKMAGLMYDNQSTRYVRVDKDGLIETVPVSESDWQYATINLGATTGAAVDLGKPYPYMRAIIPTMDSCYLTIQVSETLTGTYYTLGDSQTTSTGTFNYADTFKIGGYRYVRFVASAAQSTAEVAIRVSGVGGL